MRVILFTAICLIPVSLSVGLAQDKPAKLPVPDKASQAKSLELIKGLYDADYADAKTSEQKFNLAKMLLGTGNNEKRDVVGRFVLFSEAARFGAEAGDFELAFQAVKKKVEGYQVDGLLEKAEILNAVIGKLRRPQDHKALAEPMARLITAAIDSDRYDVAKRVGKLAYASARKTKNSEATRNARAQIKKLSEIEKAFKGAKTALAILETNPTDPDANLVAGKFRCFVKEDWKLGLSMLALGSSESLRKLAGKELKGANNVKNQIELGDAWWDIAENEESRAKEQILSHAAYWYQQALPRSNAGLTKIRLAKRIKIVAAIQEKDNGATEAAPFDYIKSRERKFTAVMGGDDGDSSSTAFNEFPKAGGYLVGFKVTMHRYLGQFYVVRSLQAIYMTENGLVMGSTFGTPQGNVQTIQAKAGYAVGAITGGQPGDHRVGGFETTFMRIRGNSLDPTDAYKSEWIGGKTQGNPKVLAGDGKPVVGIHGHYYTRDLKSLGLIQIR